MIRKHIVYNPVLERNFRLEKALGSFLWTENGRRLIDFTSGWNTANLGWNHPEISEAVRNQLTRNTFTPSGVADPTQERYAAALVAQLPASLNVVCRTTSGTESNEQAIKIARAATGRKTIIGFTDTYHGSTFASLSIGYRPEYVTDVAPVVGDFIQMDFPALVPGIDGKKKLSNFLENLEQTLKNRDVAAIITEAGMITGWGSMLVTPDGYLTAVRKVTQEYGTLLILDEVGTGFSRTGKLFAHQHESVIPDILTLAKAMTNGVAAMGACIANDALISPIIGKAKVLSSLAWMPLACAAAEKVLGIHVRDAVWKMAEENGSWLMSELEKRLKGYGLSYVRGRGMEIGIDFIAGKDSKPVGEIVREAFRQGLLVTQSDDSTIQLMPPLNTPKEVLDEGIGILVDSVRKGA